MKNIIIRKVKNEDAEQYIKLNNLVWRDAYGHIFPEEVFEERELKTYKKIKEFASNVYNSDKQFVYVAEINGVIVGFISCQLISQYKYFADKGYADLMAIYIHPNYQGKGIGSKFKQLFVEWLKSKGINKFVVGVLQENHKARAVYEKWGGILDEYTQQFVKLGKGYTEVFYTFNV